MVDERRDLSTEDFVLNELVPNTFVANVHCASSCSRCGPDKQQIRPSDVSQGKDRFTYSKHFLTRAAVSSISLVVGARTYQLYPLAPASEPNGKRKYPLHPGIVGNNYGKRGVSATIRSKVTTIDRLFGAQSCPANTPCMRCVGLTC